MEICNGKLLSDRIGLVNRGVGTPSTILAKFSYGGKGKEKKKKRQVLYGLYWAFKLVAVVDRRLWCLQG